MRVPLAIIFMFAVGMLIFKQAQWNKIRVIYRPQSMQQGSVRIVWLSSSRKARKLRAASDNFLPRKWTAYQRRINGKPSTSRISICRERNSSSRFRRDNTEIPSPAITPCLMASAFPSTIYGVSFNPFQPIIDPQLALCQIPARAQETVLVLKF